MCCGLEGEVCEDLWRFDEDLVVLNTCLACLCTGESRIEVRALLTLSARN
jgi:hypothetical protein